MSNLDRFEAMLEAKADELKVRKGLVAYIHQLNAEAIQWMKAEEGRVASMLTDDPQHWADYGVYTAEQLGDYLDAAAEHNARKDNW